MKRREGLFSQLPQESPRQRLSQLGRDRIAYLPSNFVLVPRETVTFGECLQQGGF